MFALHLTIGEVGLNEIRLSDKNDRLETTAVAFNKIQTDKIRLHQNSRESLTLSSDFSSRNSSRQYTKTTSPYSSTNSLSSIDSAGILNTNVIAAAAAAAAAATLHRNAAPPVAPQRKKRAAPRPPSQNSIPENHENRVVSSATTIDNDGFKKPAQPLALPRRNFHVSHPNLSVNDTKAMQYDEFNNNNGSTNANIESHGSTNTINRLPARPTTMTFLRENGLSRTEELRSSEVRHSTPYLNHSRTSSDSSEIVDGMPEPRPRKRTFIGMMFKRK